MNSGALMLSDHPHEKLRVFCEKCGRRAQYDKQAMLEAGGDRKMPDLRVDITKQLGCQLALNPGVNLYDRCQMRFD